MTAGLPFVALWSEVGAEGPVLHILNRETHSTRPLPEISTNARSVEEFLPELIRAVPSPDEHARWLFLLEPCLPAAWLELRWESLALANQALASQAVVVRNARWAGERPANAGGVARFLNLFPPNEFDFLDHLQPLIKSGVLRSCRKRFLNQACAGDDFFLMAHGRESGLVDEGGGPFILKDLLPPPRRVWLLACNIDGALNVLAQDLLNRGCETVIAATAELSAPAMAALVEDWLINGRKSGDIAAWIARTKDQRTGDGCIQTLTLWGGIDLDPSPCSAWNRLTWDDEHGQPRRLPLDDEATRQEFHDAHGQAVSHYAWPSTRRWMLPPLLWLAEKHDHTAMHELSEAIGDTESPKAIRSLAAAARRVGNYVQTARYLALGLASPAVLAVERAEYLGALANLFIDVNLPESAATAIERHEDCALDAARDRNLADFKRLDWMSRMEARRGRLAIALDLMTTKRKRAESDSGRELAWQLYLSAWGLHAGQVSKAVAASFADEVAQRLSRADPGELGYGNETTAYLLRSCAAHAWATNDQDNLKLAGRWLAYAESRLTDDDPGPWAYSIVFLHLQHAAPSGSFDRAISQLERARYYLEAASLAGLAGDPARAKKLMERFQQRRRDILARLNAPLGDMTFEAHAEAELRAVHESDRHAEGIVNFSALPL